MGVSKIEGSFVFFGFSNSCPWCLPGIIHKTQEVLSKDVVLGFCYPSIDPKLGRKTSKMNLQVLGSQPKSDKELAILFSLDFLNFKFQKPEFCEVWLDSVAVAGSIEG